MVREIQIRLALTELKLINVFKKREILNNQTEVIKMKKNYINFIINNNDI